MEKSVRYEFKTIQIHFLPKDVGQNKLLSTKPIFYIACKECF